MRMLRLRPQKIVSESEVMQIAMAQSNQLIEQTNAQAQEILTRLQRIPTISV